MTVVFAAAWEGGKLSRWQGMEAQGLSSKRYQWLKSVFLCPSILCWLCCLCLEKFSSINEQCVKTIPSTPHLFCWHGRLSWLCHTQLKTKHLNILCYMWLAVIKYAYFVTDRNTLYVCMYNAWMEQEGPLGLGFGSSRCHHEQ